MTTETVRIGRLYREQLVHQIKEGVDKNKNIFVISYSRLSGAQINTLRKDLKKAGADVTVFKNSLARRALTELKHNQLGDRLSGQTALIWGNTDSVQVSKILVKFIKEFEQVSLQGGLLEGQILQKDDVKRLSELPSREVLLAKLLGTIQAPLTRLAYVLNAKTGELISILKQLSEKKGGN